MVRPELGSTDALVMMMDARGMLYELKASAQLACTPSCMCSCSRHPVRCALAQNLKTKVQSSEPEYIYDQDLAATPKDSRERFEARRLLPGMAKRIREVCGPRKCAFDEQCYRHLLSKECFASLTMAVSMQDIKVEDYQAKALQLVRIET